MRYTERPDLYDLNQPGDVFPGEREHYLALARQAGGPVLELGYGTGRVGLHLARAGVPVVGLDRAETMLAEARRVLQAEPPEVADRVELVEGDMADFDLGRTFGLVYVPFRAFLHLQTQEEQRACLRCVRRHLEPGGLFAGNFFQPDPALLQADPTLRMEPVKATPDGGRVVQSSWCTWADRNEQRKRVILRIDRYDAGGMLQESTINELDLAWIYGREWRLLLELEGFRLERLEGGFEGQPVSAGREYVWVASRVP